MAGVRIVTDSACDLSAEEAAEHGIEVVPLTIRFGSDEYEDRTELSVERFYELMASSSALPETAAPAPGKFDAALFIDGQAFRPDGRTAATLIPAAFGLAGVNLHTYTGWGGVSHWNAFVANLEMHGQGTFLDARLDDELRFPVAARAGFGHVRNDPDLITSKLPALHFYQLALPAPEPPANSFDACVS